MEGGSLLFLPLSFRFVCHALLLFFSNQHCGFLFSVHIEGWLYRDLVRWEKKSFSSKTCGTGHIFGSHLIIICLAPEQRDMVERDDEQRTVMAQGGSGSGRCGFE